MGDPGEGNKSQDNTGQSEEKEVPALLKFLSLKAKMRIAPLYLWA